MISHATKQRERLDMFMKVTSKEAGEGAQESCFCDPSIFRDSRGRKAKTVEKARAEAGR